MSPRWNVLLAIAAATFLVVEAHAASPRSSVTAGKALYQTYCVACHGTSGVGNGPRASALSTPPADLTSLSARTNGKFPELYVTRAIDGESFAYRELSPDMPSWGRLFRRTQPEAEATQRIDSLTKYLRSLQVPKPPLRHTGGASNGTQYVPAAQAVVSAAAPPLDQVHTVYIQPSSDGFLVLLRSRLERWGAIAITSDVNDADAILTCETETKTVPAKIVFWRMWAHVRLVDRHSQKLIWSTEKFGSWNSNKLADEVIGQLIDDRSRSAMNH